MKRGSHTDGSHPSSTGPEPQPVGDRSTSAERVPSSSQTTGPQSEGWVHDHVQGDGGKRSTVEAPDPNDGVGSGNAEAAVSGDGAVISNARPATSVGSASTSADRSGGGAALGAFELTCAAGRRTVVADASFEVRAGELIGIVGPNGSGKTTLLHVLAGLNRPQQGRVVVDGHVLHELSQRQRARVVALVAQDERPPADLLAGEVVALGRTPYLPPWGAGSPRERETVEAALRTVDLAGFADRPVHRLSGGERQRVLLARALVQDTPVLLLDEPTNHLDITHQLQLLTLARRLNRTIVMALHDLALADRYCDRILVLHNGRAGPLEEPQRALRPEVLATVFGVRAARIAHPETGESHLLITPREAAL